MFESEYFLFMKYFLYFIITFSIIIHIILNIDNETSNMKIFYLNKALFYFFILFICVIINDILDTKLQFLWKFVFIILSALVLVYISNNLLINRYNKGEWKTFGLSLLSTFVIFLLVCAIVYFTILGKGERYSDPIFLQFNYAVYINYSFLLFILFYFIFIKSVTYWTDWDTYFTDMISVAIYGFLLILFVFIIFIHLAIKIKLITSIQQLNTFIAILVFILFLGILQLYFFISGIKSICDNKLKVKESKEESNKIERLTLILLFCILVVLWLDDSRQWLQSEYFLFILATLVIIACMFHYSMIYPSISILSLWGFIEWCILVCYNGHDTWNSFNFVMQNTKYNLRKK